LWQKKRVETQESLITHRGGKKGPIPKYHRWNVQEKKKKVNSVPELWKKKKGRGSFPTSQNDRGKKGKVRRGGNSIPSRKWKRKKKENPKKKREGEGLIPPVFFSEKKKRGPDRGRKKKKGGGFVFSEGGGGGVTFLDLPKKGERFLQLLRRSPKGKKGKNASREPEGRDPPLFNNAPKKGKDNLPQKKEKQTR